MHSRAPFPIIDPLLAAGRHSFTPAAESNLLGLTSGLRQPSYSTDNMAMVDGINSAAIVQVAAFNAGGGDATRPSGGDDEKMSFQVASLDNRGNLVFWVVVELSVNELCVACVAVAAPGPLRFCVPRAMRSTLAHAWTCPAVAVVCPRSTWVWALGRASSW